MDPRQQLPAGTDPILTNGVQSTEHASTWDHLSAGAGAETAGTGLKPARSQLSSVSTAVAMQSTTVETAVSASSCTVSDTPDRPAGDHDTAQPELPGSLLSATRSVG
ncbi:unnamed protein product [Phytophthora fragariaefolia]|uniref:Unnamed protein product n=1 Tax=Phytophthora fragariaefolia TaxID=1490495 RepID=A0A9W6XZW1_9STRA|nr:unnamed protein product [Phytophthora fragariaefolia]